MAFSNSTFFPAAHSSGFFSSATSNPKFEIYYKSRSTELNGRNSAERINDLYESIKWFNISPKTQLSDEEKRLIAKRYTDLTSQLKDSTHTVFISLRQFWPEASTINPRRIGLEAEYARSVKTLPTDDSLLRYSQSIGSIHTSKANGNLTLANIKLDSITQNKKNAIIELEFKPFAVASNEFAMQLQIIDSFRTAILKAEKNSDVKTLLEKFAQESPGYEVKIVKDPALIFGCRHDDIGPTCQVTIEIPLSRFGDPDDTETLNLVEKQSERQLLQHARTTANSLVELLRPTAVKLHGNLFSHDSIKLAKIHGYFTEAIMQICQLNFHQGNKLGVGFHIRTAGPARLSARDKALLNIFFEKSLPNHLDRFKRTLQESLDEGVKILSPNGAVSNDMMRERHAYMLMRHCSDIEVECLKFIRADRRNLEFAYGMTLVELRHVQSAFNKGIVERTANATTQLNNVQALLESRPRKR